MTESKVANIIEFVEGLGIDTSIGQFSDNDDFVITTEDDDLYSKLFYIIDSNERLSAFQNIVRGSRIIINYISSDGNFEIDTVLNMNKDDFIISIRAL